MQRLNDNFHEEIIVRRKKGLYSLLYVLASMGMILFAIGAAMTLQFILQTPEEGGISVNWLFAIIFVVCAGLAFLLFWSRNFMRVDYEYSFTNGSMDIAKVMNNKTRKEMMIFAVKDIELMAPIMTNGFDRFQSKTDVKNVRAWLNRDSKKYFMILRYNEQQTMLIMEPSEKMVKLIKKYNPIAVKT